MPTLSARCDDECNVLVASDGPDDQPPLVKHHVQAEEDDILDDSVDATHEL